MSVLGFIETIMPRQRYKTRFWRIAIPTLAVAGLALGITLAVLYQQLVQTFDSQESNIPTRIYSDVVRIGVGMPKSTVTKRLKNLNYTVEAVASESPELTALRFTLPEIHYPTYLIPDGHATLEIQNQFLTLKFGPKESPILQKIETASGTEIPDFYLEPELVARLARSGDLDKNTVRESIPFQEFPSLLWKAIIAIEDQHFLEHNGLDPRGLMRAVFINLKTLSLKQGGSTLTQQLVKNLMARRSKNLFKKANEIVLSLMLEARFDKERILERYLNEVYLGQIGSLEVHGVAEGAKHFFGKKLDDLNLGEIALLAGIIRGPFYYSPYNHLDRAMERQKLVLQKMVETGLIAEEEGLRAQKLPIRIAPAQTSGNKAPYFSDFVKAELLRLLKGRLNEQEISDAGFRVYTTLDTELNQMAQDAVSKGIIALEKSLKIPETDPLEGALASVNPHTGNILALVGGRDYQQSTFNRILNMKRQVGSTFKPVVYLSALLKERDPRGIPYGPAYPVEDAPWTLHYDKDRQKWSPQNYTRKHLGWIPMRTALAESVNVAAAKIGIDVGLPFLIQTARRVGIDSEIPRVPSLTLGVPELSPVELVRVYSTLANRGSLFDLNAIRSITTEDGKLYARFTASSTQALPPEIADWMTHLLQSVFKEGTAKVAADMGFDRAAAGKTGTTSNYRDSWFAGYTPQYTTVVWVGFDSGVRVDEKGRTKVPLTGAGTALPIWTDYMKRAHLGISPTEFAVPGQASPPDSLPVTLEKVSIDRRSGFAAAKDCAPQFLIDEVYLKDHPPQTEPVCVTQWPSSESETHVEFSNE